MKKGDIASEDLFVVLIPTREGDHSEDCPVGQAIRAAKAACAAGSGPAQVATPAYRTHWDSIFGARQEVGQA